MQQVKSAIIQANNFFKIADHLAYVSYPLLKDNKLLILIAKNLYMSGLRAVDAVLYYERLYKRLDAFPSDVDSRIHLFEKQIALRIHVKPEVAKTIKDLGLIIQQHKESPVAFSRKERFVICSSDYALVKTIDIQMLKSYILVIRDLLHFVNNLGKDV